jgi:hypothetical protein
LEIIKERKRERCLWTFHGSRIEAKPQELSIVWFCILTAAPPQLVVEYPNYIHNIDECLVFWT